MTYLRLAPPEARSSKNVVVEVVVVGSAEAAEAAQRSGRGRRRPAAKAAGVVVEGTRAAVTGTAAGRGARLPEAAAAAEVGLRRTPRGMDARVAARVAFVAAAAGRRARARACAADPRSGAAAGAPHDASAVARIGAKAAVLLLLSGTSVAVEESRPSCVRRDGRRE
jgi:hypothetical protein